MSFGLITMSLSVFLENIFYEILFIKLTKTKITYFARAWKLEMMIKKILI